MDPYKNNYGESIKHWIVLHIILLDNVLSLIILYINCPHVESNYERNKSAIIKENREFERHEM